jgi:quercetin dioxygenase-like cupin family protein
MKLKGEAIPVIDPALEAELLAALAPIEPAPQRSRAMWSRIEAAIGEPARPQFVTVHRGEGDWHPIAPRVAIKPLVEGEGLSACLIRMEKGGWLPPHDHPTAEECVVLEGEVWLGDVHCRAGDFHLAPAGLRHGALRTDEGCLLYVRTGGGKGAALL